MWYIIISHDILWLWKNRFNFNYWLWYWHFRDDRYFNFFWNFHKVWLLDIFYNFIRTIDTIIASYWHWYMTIYFNIFIHRYWNLWNINSEKICHGNYFLKIGFDIYLVQKHTWTVFRMVFWSETNSCDAGWAGPGWTAGICICSGTTASWTSWCGKELTELWCSGANPAKPALTAASKASGINAYRKYIYYWFFFSRIALSVANAPWKPFSPPAMSYLRNYYTFFDLLCCYLWRFHARISPHKHVNRNFGGLGHHFQSKIFKLIFFEKNLHFERK